MVNFHDFKTPLDQKNKILSKIKDSYFLFNVCCILISETDLQFKSAGTWIYRHAPWSHDYRSWMCLKRISGILKQGR